LGQVERSGRVADHLHKVDLEIFDCGAACFVDACDRVRLEYAAAAMAAFAAFLGRDKRPGGFAARWQQAKNV
jgi:hypothetical protein